MTLGNGLSDLDSSSPALIKRNRIRAPGQHGEALVVPAPAQIPELWDHNLQTIQQHSFSVNGQSIGQLRNVARTHLVAAAQKYTSQYCDPVGPVELVASESSRVIMSGHQPRLFHPGVWFKNFALSGLGRQLGATAINLVVDNDLCGHPSVAVPVSTKESGQLEASTVSVAYDRAGGNIPFENREILDREIFDSFGERLRAAIAPVVAQPMVEPLWQNAMLYRDPQNRLGHTLAAARHKWEADLGLRTLELPLSRFCESEPFAHFLLEIVNRIHEFQQIYNQSLLEYRQVNRIRSNAHPVPALEQAGDWFELPFWIWSDKNRLRQALYVRQTENQMVLSNRDDWELLIDSAEAVNQIATLSGQGIAIRPRALTTTMYSRTFLSDLFIHGIGGAKYDQLTDAIIARFWQVTPPAYLTVTATFQLPFEFEPVAYADITAETVRLRELRFHPERFVDKNNESAQALIAEKWSWINRSSDASIPDFGKQRHDAITRCNESLHRLVIDQASQATTTREQKRQQLTRSRILGSREYSFCCFAQERCQPPFWPTG